MSAPMVTTETGLEPEWLSLFNSRAFHALNTDAGQEALLVPYHEDDRLVCVLSGVLEGDRFTAGFSAPFGGPDFARPRETPARVVAALTHAVAELDRRGAATIRVRARSASWSANEAVVQFALLNLGFRVETADLSYALDLRRFATHDAYFDALKSPARRALRHAQREPFAFAEVDDWAAPYTVLDANRRQHDRVLALGPAYLDRARQAFPGRVRMFALHHDGAICAAALVFAVTPTRWYVQAWGDALHALPRSPMNVLVLELVRTALDEGVEVMDLGRTTDPAQPGQPLQVSSGLAQFKQSILAHAELRPVLVR
ncbi:MAG: family N-acetyltransferase [Solirubrobacteraceae bacterium]|nr:family N-acetyltransferase [Solirubrobacteraceae bacterium]